MWAATIKPKIDILLNEGDNLRKPLIWLKDRQTTITKYSDNEYAMWTENGIYIINKNYFDESTISIFSKS